MHAMLWKCGPVLWGFKQDIRLLGEFKHDYKHQHEYLIFPVSIHHYESVSEPNFFIF